MQFLPPCFAGFPGRSAALLASLLIVGSAAAADVAPEDPALAMVFPTMQPSFPRPAGSVELIGDGMAGDEVAPPAADEAAPPAALVAGIGQAIDADVLDGFRGGDAVESNVVIDGSVSGNTADRIVSGSNTIQDGAFANSNGINTVIQNSGSNVLIQNGMVVNVQFVDPGL